MAKKRTPAKKKSGKKRVGAAKFNAFHPIVQLGALGLGIALGKPIDEQAEKINKGKVDGKIIAGAEVGVGTAAMLIKFGKKRQAWEFLQVGAGGVLAGAGIYKAYQEYKKWQETKDTPAAVQGYQKVPVLNGAGQVTGYQMVPVVGKRIMNGYHAGPPAIGGYATSSNPISGVMGSSGSGRIESADFLN